MGTSIAVAILLFYLSLSHGFKISSHSSTTSQSIKMAGDADILVRTLRGESVERTPVWLMRQAGRYMADFRKYSDKYPFRERSETPEIAIELSLQPWRRFGVDGVIMFSDILTPLPAMGIDFTIIPGKGPKIVNPIKGKTEIDQVKILQDVGTQVPFLGPILQSLRKEVEGKTSLIGFIGAPWTLAAYSVEGGHSKLCKGIKGLCLEDPALAHQLLDKYTESLCKYVTHQIESGAQVMQVFESWAHHLSEEQFVIFAKPYAQRIAEHVRKNHPEIPVVYFANGGSVYLHRQLEMEAFNGFSLDWKISMSRAREISGANTVLAGNVDPIVLYGSEANIRKEVRNCISQAKGKHVLNLGHGVEKDISEHSVQVFVEEARNIKLLSSNDALV